MLRSYSSFRMKWYTSWLCVLVILGSSHSARILGVFPMPSISHQLPYRAVMMALAHRGHQVTVITANPIKTPIINYTEVDLSFTYEYWAPTMVKIQKDKESVSPYDTLNIILDMFPDLCHFELSSDVMQKFIKARQKFDLVMIESIYYPCMIGLAHISGSPPVIGMLSMGGTAHTFDSMGSPYNPAIHPDIMLPYDEHMTFWERVDSFIFWLWSKYFIYFKVAPSIETISKQYFGNDAPSVLETERNYSLLMVNNHWSTSYPMALVPGIIQLGSLHVQKERNPLPKDIKEFLDGATQGFVYFSLGSNVRSDRLSEFRRNQFLEAFAELPQRVLWKWESDSLPGQPRNVMVKKWLPQQDVLAHPNIKVFITQGGLQSQNEATYFAVPQLGVPFFGDQPYNVKNMVNKGVALQLDFETATKDSILKALRTLIEDPRYQENMKKFSAISKDQPETPVERAVWWTEYVLRHNGARHLRSAALDLNWFQYLLLDVIAFLIATSLAAILLIWFISRTMYRYVVNSFSSTRKSKVA